MEEKKLSKDDEKILEIEEAYIDLIKAYSLCLTALKVRPYRNVKKWLKAAFSLKFSSTEAILLGNILAPRLTKWRIRRQVDLLRAAFLLLISQNRKKIDSKIIKRFETYCEDMNELGAQFKKSSLISLFYGSITAVAAILVQLFARLDDVSGSEDVHVTLDDVHVDDVLFGDLLGYLALFYLVYFFVGFLLLGFWGSKRVFREASVLEKEEKNFVLMQEYSKFV